MNMWKLGSIGIFLGLFLGCGGQALDKQLQLQFEGKGKSWKQGARVGVSVANRSDVPLDSVRYFLDGKALEYTDGTVVLSPEKLGTHTLEARAYLQGQTVPLQEEVVVLAPAPPELYTYEIVNTYPHDIEAFTQGLEFRGDTLYESTGQRGASSLRKVDFRTGEILEQTALERTYFGEGITLLGERLYMLTWQSKVGFLYNPNTLERTGTFQYGESREGWGLCNDGTRIYKSDGSQRIWILDPETLQETGHLETVTDRSVFNKANELEYVDGLIYANVWQKPSMMIIDAASGAITGVVNFGGLERSVTQHDRLDVLNGVAYHKERGTFFVTGKRWDKLFEVRILKKTP
ncbi:glutaminyl-peptide cyclotransferase [Robiginitalea sp. M366]|uniref:glutaminyl-peptide cyclotransferase n=1 Tax=Robiginitalea aestuariiviva TaxID=3036903 RepID=UPI00240D3F28|nr:glutaminyl-peptide cyclotransferase [Robiginitalea aestuariiviva]MDG1573101.1 glutaminyl-peptide cyclotransferase [Robiginitalea aestuariiviva]